VGATGARGLEKFRQYRQRRRRHGTVLGERRFGADAKLGSGIRDVAGVFGAQCQRPDIIQSRLRAQVGGGLQGHAQNPGEVGQRQLVVRGAQDERLADLR
jgi:hypothetical protein